MFLRKMVQQPGSCKLGGHGYKLGLVSSAGGHLTDLVTVADAFSPFERFWVVNERSPVLPEGERAYLIQHAERDWRVAWNTLEIARIYALEKPDIVLSTGAGPAVPAAIVARLVGVPFVYLEASCAVERLTLSGHLVRPIASRFFVQWPRLAEGLRGVRYAGGVL